MLLPDTSTMPCYTLRTTRQQVVSSWIFAYKSSPNVFYLVYEEWVHAKATHLRPGVIPVRLLFPSSTDCTKRTSRSRCESHSDFKVIDYHFIGDPQLWRGVHLESAQNISFCFLFMLAHYVFVKEQLSHLYVFILTLFIRETICTVFCNKY